MNDIIEQMLKKNFIDIWTVDIFQAMINNATLDEIKEKLFEMAEGIVCLKRNISCDSSSLCLAMVNILWEKALANFQSKEYKDKENLLKGLSDFFEEITKAEKIRISVVADPLMLKTLKQFYLRGAKVGPVEVEVNNLLIETGGISEEMASYLRKKEILVVSHWQNFVNKSKNDYPIVIGGKFLLPSEKEFKERIFQLLQQGKSVFIFETINFSDEELRNLEDIINTSRLPENEIVFWNGEIKVKKPFSIETDCLDEDETTGLLITFGTRQPD